MFYIRILGDDDTVSAAGTGVILSADGTAATAYHVVKNASHIEGILHDGRVVDGIEVVAYNEETDAAVVQLPTPVVANEDEDSSYPVLSIRKGEVKHGEKVFAIGYPMKDTPIITEGIVNSPNAEINGRSRILTSAQVVSGMSGGPLLDRQGRLVGIISGSMRTMNNIHLVIDMKDLGALLPDDKPQT